MVKPSDTTDKRCHLLHHLISFASGPIHVGTCSPPTYMLANTATHTKHTHCSISTEGGKCTSGLELHVVHLSPNSVVGDAPTHSRQYASHTLTIRPSERPSKQSALYPLADTPPSVQTEMVTGRGQPAACMGLPLTLTATHQHLRSLRPTLLLHVRLTLVPLQGPTEHVAASYPVSFRGRPPRSVCTATANNISLMQNAAGSLSLIGTRM